MRLTHVSPLVLVLLVPGMVRSAEIPQFGLRVPPGFEVTEFADSGLANDIFSMTLDPRAGWSSPGRGYIRILVDDDNDGRADRATRLRRASEGRRHGSALGRRFHLYFMGDGGLRRFRTATDAGHVAGPSELIRTLKTGGEHDAHAIRRGPDGWLYVLCGNITGIDRKLRHAADFADQGPGGRLRAPVLAGPQEQRNRRRWFPQRLRHGLQPDGELFTFDSDNERCVSLPWYEPTRFYHVIPGGHYGWLAPQHAQFWRLPPYFADVVAPGRHAGPRLAHRRRLLSAYAIPASATAAACSCSTGPSARSISCRWSARARRTHAGRRSSSNRSATTASRRPLRWSIPNTGDLYISIGGRGTRGAVYRIRYPEGFKSCARPARPSPQPKSRSLDAGLNPKSCSSARMPRSRASGCRH